MNTYLVYNRRTGDIRGFCKASDDNSLPNPRTPDEAFLEITDKERIAAITSLNLRKERISGKVRGEKILEFQIQPIYQGKIRLSTDASDNDGDGIPELPADGVTSAKIRAIIQNQQGNIMKAKSAKVMFKVSRGTLSKREAEVKDGIAEVELKSAGETTQSLIIASADKFAPDSITLEFIPVEEFQMLSKRKRKK